MKFSFLRTIWQYIVPQHLLSRLVGQIAHSQILWLKNFLIERFIKRYGVDMTQAQQPDPRQYKHFNDFFTRAIRLEQRPLAMEPSAIACPVDGRISQIGRIQTGRIFQAKGVDYSLEALLGTQRSPAPRDDEKKRERGKEASGGREDFRTFATFYLSPKDYHRVHMPLSGTLIQMTYVPGRLFSVNPASVHGIPGLFTKNERVVCHFKTATGDSMAVILVGAMIVASIETVWAGLIAPEKSPLPPFFKGGATRNREVRTWHYPADSIRLNKGEELGRFQLGSTVIVLFSSPQVEWEPTLRAEHAVLMGEKIGHT